MNDSRKPASVWYESPAGIMREMMDGHWQKANRQCYKCGKTLTAGFNDLIHLNGTKACRPISKQLEK